MPQQTRRYFVKMMALVIMVMVAVASFSVDPSYAAMDVKEAKEAGKIGEQPDGLLGIVNEGSASRDIEALVEETNAKRLEKYEEVAQKNGTSLEKVKALAGKKLIMETPSGTYIKTAAGEWRQKP